MSSLEVREWCGDERPSDNRRDALDNGSFRYHAIYLSAADVPSRFEGVASAIQSAAFEASALLERAYRRAIRFDMGTRCGTSYLDISSIRGTATAADFEAAALEANGTLGLVSKQLTSQGFTTLRPGASRRAAAKLTRNFVVWLDAPAPAGSCGAADVLDDPTRSPSNWNNYGGKVAVVYRYGDGFCGADAVRHEIGHTLGALQSVAPNTPDGTHCNDAYEDTMCSAESPVRGGGAFEGEYFDFGNDDYWDPPKGKPLKWWTANLNRFLCPVADCNSKPVTRRGAPRSSRVTSHTTMSRSRRARS